MLVIIDKFLIEVENKYSEGHELTKLEAQIMNSLYLDKFQAQLRRFIAKNPNATHSQVLDEARAIQDTLVLDHDEGEDIIAAEALTISREKIIARLAAEGLPPPTNLDLHATELARDSAILADAKRRVEARFKAGLDLAQLNQ